MNITTEFEIIKNIKDAKVKQIALLDDVSKYIKDIENNLTTNLPDVPHTRTIKFNDGAEVRVTWTEHEKRMRLCVECRDYAGEGYFDGIAYIKSTKPIIELNAKDRMQAAAAIPTFLSSFLEIEGESKNKQFENYHQKIFGSSKVHDEENENVFGEQEYPF